MAVPKITVRHSPIEPLAWIPKQDWKKVISEKTEFVAGALNVDLNTALKILDEFEELRAWEYVDLSRNEFLKYKCHIQPDDLPKIRQGFAIMRGGGLEAHTATEALACFHARADQARKDAEQADEHKRGGVNLPDNVRKVPDDGGNSSSYLLRRLARQSPDTLEAYERGEFKSARSAAIAAGIVKPASNLDVLRRVWGKSSQEERETFLEEIK